MTDQKLREEDMKRLLRHFLPPPIGFKPWWRATQFKAVSRRTVALKMHQVVERNAAICDRKLAEMRPRPQASDSLKFNEDRSIVSLEGQEFKVADINITQERDVQHEYRVGHSRPTATQYGPWRIIIRNKAGAVLASKCIQGSEEWFSDC